MFTGLVTDVGRVRSISGSSDRRIEIECGFDTSELAIGASIACSGVCLTAVELAPTRFAVEASGETLSKTTVGSWREGTAVNLETSLRIGDELGGHLVFGHVDGVATVMGRRSEGDSIRFSFGVSKELARFVASKGCVAVDGVSLTVNEVDGTTFGVNIIPHTADATTFGSLEPGSRVNIEVDMLARYVARLIESRQE